jgi:hypothetical protein
MDPVRFRIGFRRTAEGLRAVRTTSVIVRCAGRGSRDLPCARSVTTITLAMLGASFWREPPPGGLPRALEAARPRSTRAVTVSAL